MKNPVVSVVLLSCVLSFSTLSFTSHFFECKTVAKGQTELKYSAMLDLRRSQNDQNDSSGSLMTAFVGTIIADEKMQQKQSDNLVGSLIETIETLISYSLSAQVIVDRIETNILAKISTDVASKLLTQAAQGAQRLVKADVYKILVELRARLIKKKFVINVGLEDAIANLDVQKFRKYLEGAGFSETVIKQALKNLFSGCHESVSFSDYDSKGNAS